MKSLSKVLLIASVLLIIAPIIAAYADQTVSVPIATNEVFEQTGLTTKTYTVDVSQLKNAKQITIYVTGKPENDPWLRSLVVIIDGQVVHSQPFDENHKWDGTVQAYSDVVAGQFEVRYDVTNLVKGKDRVTVKLGISTYVGRWTLSARFDGVVEDSITIPNPTPEQSTLSVPVSTASAAAGVAFLAAGVFMKRREEET